MIINNLQKSPDDGNLKNAVRNRLETIPKLAIRTYSKIFIQPLESDLFNYEGTLIFERDWDLLIVLDSCRADLIQSFEAKYPFIDSRSWVEHCWWRAVGRFCRSSTRRPDSPERERDRVREAIYRIHSAG